MSQLCCCSGWVLIILLAIGYPFYRQLRRRPSDEPPPPPEDLAGKAMAIARLREHDPAFDEAAFAGRVNVAFGKIQAAWCAQDLRAVRPFISDGVFERFSLQFVEQKAEGYRDHMEAIRVTDIRIAAVSSPGVFDELTVRITAVARDWRESLADNSRLSGSGALESFTEYWTFLRRRGAVTDASRAGLIEGNCPNCGAPIEMSQSANCASCKALLRSGTYDWVLTEITQASEWSPRTEDSLPGVARLRERDPNFDVAGLEDRASVIYWRKATADRTGKIDALAKVALPQFAQRHEATLLPPTVTRTFIADTAVGSVQTLGVFTNGDWDRALVEIKWSGHQFASDPSGAITRTGQESWAATLFVLTRQRSAPSDAGWGISSAHCPTCGAPESINASSACEFCGTVLNDGLHGWLLEDLWDRNDPMADRWIQRMNRDA